jgi:pimeloyl-ACP methyl ester carboxylesterase
MAKHAQDLAAICRNEGISKAVFGGTSIGGYILFEFWRQFRERVSGMILCNTRATPDTDEARAGRLKSIADIEKRGPGPFLDESIEKLVGEATRKNRPDIVAGARRTMRHSTIAGLSAALRGMAERPDSVPTLATIDVPTLILASDEDTTPFSEASLMQQKIQTSQLVKLTGAGHYAIFEKPAETVKVMRKFLDAVAVAV